MLQTVARLARRLASRLAPNRRPFPSPGLRFRPRVDALEAREVPATWLGTVSNDAWDPQNWSGGQIPEMDEALVFDGTVSSADCLLMNTAAVGEPHWAPIAYASSIHLVNGYEGTLQIGQGFTVGTLELRSGAIDQTDIGGYDSNRLEINDSLIWTGGTLNSGDYEGEVCLWGGGEITIPETGLACGSSLEFYNLDYFNDPTAPEKTTLVSGPGVLNFRFGSPITINGGYSFVVAVAPQATAKFDGPEGSYTDGKAKIDIRQDGKMTVTGPNEWPSNNRILVNNGGTLEIKNGATARFGSAQAPPQGTPKKTDILQYSGQIQLHNGTTLTSSWGVFEMQGGALYGDPTHASRDGGTIGCQATVAGGTIRVLNLIGQIRFDKDLYWMGGVFQATVDANAGDADQIHVAGNLHVGGTATVEVLALNVPNGGLAPAFRTRIIYVMGDIFNVVPNMAPGLAVSNPSTATFQLDLKANNNQTHQYDLIPG